MKGNQIGDVGAKELASSLTSREAPDNIFVNVSDCMIGPAGIRDLISVGASDICPKGLRLICTVNSASIRELTNVMNEHPCHGFQSLELNFGGFEEVKDHGAQLLARAIMSGHAPDNFYLILGGQGIRDLGAEALAEALCSGKAPQGLRLYLNGNSRIGRKGALALAKALKSAGCPPNLHLHLDFFAGDVPPHLTPAESGLGAIQAEIVKYFVETMLYSTTVTELKIFSRSTEDTAIIEFACLRNQLIRQHSEFEHFIKAISYKHKLYMPGNKQLSPPSLMCLAAANILFHRQFNYQNATMPAELKEYISKLNDIVNKIHLSSDSNTGQNAKLKSNP